jgi:hypothetical protein
MGLFESTVPAFTWTEENQEKPQIGYPITRPRFELDTSQIQSRALPVDKSARFTTLYQLQTLQSVEGEVLYYE